MSVPVIPGLPGFAITPTRIAFGTVLTGLVPPYPGGDASILYGLDNGNPNWYGSLYTSIATLLYTTAGTAHTVTIMRPLNWTTIKTAMAKNSTAIHLTDDPGVYSTNYRYPVAGQQFVPPGRNNPTPPALVADAAISSTNKFVAYQLDDGVWQLDTIASGTHAADNLVLTTGTPDRTGATIAAGRPLFYFGATTLSDPATGKAHMSILTIASAVKANLTGGVVGGGIPALHAGDPIMVHSNNATATGVIDLVAGSYKKF